MNKNATIDKIQKNLLDLSSANPLISFNTGRKNYLYVRFPDADTLFERFYNTAGYSAKVYDSDAFRQKYESKGSTEVYFGDIAQQLYPGKDEVVLYNDRERTVKVLDRLIKNSRQIMTEKGINVLYIAFGFIVWSDSDGEHKAPLLLVPVKIKTAAYKSIYYISECEDEVIVNPALKFKLAKEGIILPDYDNVSSFNAYLKSVAALTADRKMRIMNEAVIALFSYEKMIMYEDIEGHKEEMLGHPLIDGLLSESNLRSVDGLNPDLTKIVDCNVVDADSSQLRAIGCALQGYSFVLQGPPGTGKSQTITNIIAGLLDQGKKVLFVSEKMTALKVVQRKLEEAGLGDYCLELHSHKANKKEFVKELHRVLGIAEERSVSAEAERIRRERDKAAEELDEYCKELSKDIPKLGMTVYDLYGIYTETVGAADVDFVIFDIESKGLEELENVLDKLAEYSYYCSAGADPDYKASPWSVLKDDVDIRKKPEVSALLREIADASAQMVKISGELAKYNFSFDYVDEGEKVCAFADALAACSAVTAERFDAIKRKKTIAALDEYEAAKTENDSLRAETALQFDDGVLALDLDAMAMRFNTYSGWTRIFKSSYRKDMAALAFYRIPGTAKSDFSNTYAQIQKLRKRKESDKRLADAISQLFNVGLSESSVVFADRIRNLDKVIEKYSLNTDVFAALIPRELADAKKVLAQAARSVRQNLPILSKALAKAEKYFENFAGETTDFVTIGNKASDLYLQPAFETYVAMRDIAEELAVTGDDGFISDAAKKGIPADKWKDSYKKRFFFQWLERVIIESGKLRIFNSDDHNSTVREFCEKDVDSFIAARKEISQKLNERRGKAPLKQKLALEAEAAKSNRLTPVRKLLSEVMPELIQELKPCFMMSPLSVSTYLREAGLRFDVVIFDEASQVLPEDAVCAIYRGEQVIIVGDSMQMPPSNLFAAGVDSGEEYDEDTAEEGAEAEESILALGAKVLDDIGLKWHYRSRNESLIAFSNAKFYSGNLQTFPSTVVKQKDFGVEHVYVKDGVYENNVNKKEAEKVVDLIFGHIAVHPERSLGVVAFGIKQRDLIEESVAKRRAALTDPAEIAAANTFFDENRPEPFFIKNLETVQGDERDTVIFSMGYGKDPAGKFSHNFGPLNRKGGERRLNVAITRAKYNVKLVTSVLADEIRANADSPTGVQLLKAYVGYAAGGGASGLAAGSGAGILRSVEDDIYDCLTDAGYSVERNVGASKYKVDLAVKRPGKDEYVVAVECDGKEYQDVKSPRDRDRLRTSVLMSMGWKVYRIWSTQWVKDREGEKQRLLNFVTLALL